MPKYYGSIGFVETVETAPDVWEEQITEHNYFGDILKVTKRWQGTSHLNDDLTISNRISIVSDPYANDNFQNIRFAEWLGTKWKVTSVEVAFPRLVLDLGGVYNEQNES